MYTRPLPDEPLLICISDICLQEMIDRARANAKKRNLRPPHVAFVEARLTDPLPINSDSIDCILSNCVINLLPPEGKRTLLKEVCRVLKPGGRVCLDDVSIVNPFD